MSKYGVDQVVGRSIVMESLGWKESVIFWILSNFVKAEVTKPVLHMVKENLNLIKFFAMEMILAMC